MTFREEVALEAVAAYVKWGGRRTAARFVRADDGHHVYAVDSQTWWEYQAARQIERATR